MRFLLDHDVTIGAIFLGTSGTMSRSCVTPFPETRATTRFAVESGRVLLTCNRDDFLALSAKEHHHGIVIVIRRRSRAEERAALFRLLERFRRSRSAK